jgi:tellurium resistance protein TerD
MSEVLNLTKGERVDLTKVAPGVVKFACGLGWNPNKSAGDFDLDASALLMKDGKATAASDLVYFRSVDLKSSCGSVVHSGDNLTGEGDGDDETITLDTSKIDTNKYNEVEIAVVIYDAESRKQTFGQVDDAFIRVYNPDTKVEICRYDLSEDYSTATTVVVGKLYYKNDAWRFQAVGTGSAGGLKALCLAAGLATA